MTQTFQNGVPISLESTQNELAFPTGAITPFAGTATPTGTVNSVSAWLICNGASYGTATYPTLFNAIGYTYGGSGTAFNVPDLRGRIPMGSGTGAGQGSAVGPGTAPTGTALTARSVGAYGGDERLHAHTHTASQVSHSHNVTDPGFTPSVNNISVGAGGIGYYGRSFGAQALFTDSQQPAVTVSNNTQGGVSQNMPPFIVINYIIKT